MSAASPRRSPVAIATVASKNYLSWVRVLAQACRTHHPDIPFFCLLIDEPDGCFEPADEPFAIVRLDDVSHPHPDALRFGYSALQVSISTKPYLMRHLLAQGFDAIVLLDADTLVLGPLNPLLDAVARHAVVLTPHLLHPMLSPGGVDAELTVLTAGAYNGGCVAVRDTPSTQHFLAWWADRQARHCLLAPGDGMHLDQRWLDLAPALFDDVVVVRHPGCNVAYWNLHERLAQLHWDDPVTADRRCRLFHFSGFDFERPDLVGVHAPNMAMPAAAAPVFGHYAALLRAAGVEVTRRWPYSHTLFDNGVRVPDVARTTYLEMQDDDRARFGNPFATSGDGSFYTWLRAPADTDGASPWVVTRLWAAVYRQRPDVQARFPDLTGAGREGFVRWTRTSGRSEHGVGGDLGSS